MEYQWVRPPKPRKSLNQFRRVPGTGEVKGCVKIQLDNGDLVYVHVVDRKWKLVVAPTSLLSELERMRLLDFTVDPYACVGERLILTGIGGHWRTTSEYRSSGVITRIVPLRQPGRAQPSLRGQCVHDTSSDYH